ncbi:heat-inducible transcriptional repressor HrcA [Microbacterium amylolyticum]|uniref:Heat-inducible transcription repressor HrcA n=1 Tax=Microbacterium amylolyticum TaxID=936337 RepID=A0ABS4ZEF6_9MICO|nr:heat-inducible transcriptional repressor HrcA [Microbacterium amylolyticum]MBP2435649.1 heat-inducible transcriptional repressor [Microbacterium amylolyticum]
MVTDRGLQVLRAIVQDYVDTHEPVGSRSIVERHAFGVSAATIRNDMAMLEDEDLIAQPHTSSGRIPTDKGYRAFVDHLAEVRPLSRAQRSAISTFLADPADLDDLLARTVRLLTQITGQVALVQYPSFARATVTHVQLVALDPRRILVILVTDTGRVSQRITVAPVDVDEEVLDVIRPHVSSLILGLPASDAAGAVAAAAQRQATAHTAMDHVMSAILSTVAEELDEFRQNRLVMAGTATLARRGSDFRGSIHPLLEAIEEQVTLLRLMSEMAADENGLATSIGRENAEFGLSEASFIASDYDAAVGSARVGLMGPTRMDYSRNLAAARAVATYLTRLLDEDDSR